MKLILGGFLSICFLMVQCQKEKLPTETKRAGGHYIFSGEYWSYKKASSDLSYDFGPSYLYDSIKFFISFETNQYNGMIEGLKFFDRHLIFNNKLSTKHEYKFTNLPRKVYGNIVVLKDSTVFTFNSQTKKATFNFLNIETNLKEKLDTKLIINLEGYKTNEPE